MRSIMDLPEILNQNFTNCFSKGWKNIGHEERDMLYERASLLNDNFTFTKKRLQKIQLLNDILKAEEIRIRPFAETLYKVQQKWIEEKIINDYEVDVVVKCWNNNYYRKKLNKEFYGNPFFTDYTLILFVDNQDNVFYDDNWNEDCHGEDYPLKDQFHCYTFHHLSEHCVLSWFDLLKIDAVWIELRVQNQFFSELKKI